MAPPHQHAPPPTRYTHITLRHNLTLSWWLAWAPISDSNSTHPSWPAAVAYISGVPPFCNERAISHGECTHNVGLGRRVFSLLLREIDYNINIIKKSNELIGQCQLKVIVMIHGSTMSPPEYVLVWALTLSWWLVWAPQSNSTLIHSTWPASVAQISGVIPPWKEKAISEMSITHTHTHTHVLTHSY